jgi:hypothetical protein
MTPRKRVEAVLRGEKPDRVPFTIYESKLPQCAVERQLRNEGLCIVNRQHSVFREITPNVKMSTRTYVDGGVEYTEFVQETPAGKLSWLTRPAGFTAWTVKKPFTGPDDYKSMLALMKDKHYEPNYDAFIEAEKNLGEDVFLRAGIGAMPLHEIMIAWMGVETFAVEWAERRDEIEKLCAVMADNLRKIFPIVAESPALAANFGGNETGNVMGRARFERYVLPLHREAAEVMHRHGKFLGAHMDGNNRIWADLLAVSGLDYIEAFTPAPDSDMSLEDAFIAWPDKTMWTNFTSSIHLSSIAEIERSAREMLETARKPGRRFIMGVTEDMPPDRWQENMLAISRVTNEHPTRTA